jgi:GT2 family glycosyltransferase
MHRVAVLLPTCNRLQSLILTLSGLAGQTFSRFHLVLSDQSREPAENNPVVRTLCRILEARGASIEWHTRVPVHGIAEQRQFLLDRTTADMVLFLDDDVFMEPWVLERLMAVLTGERCGFVGAFPSGLSFLHDLRPHQQRIEYWEGPVRPESISPKSPEWERGDLHRAANLWHVARTLRPGERRLYKVAWVASCNLYDREKLMAVGGFSFWNRLPRYHSGEDVLVQNLLMRKWGGCAIIPSGTYHSEVPSTVLNAEGTVDGHALDLLQEMVERYCPAEGGIRHNHVQTSR